MASAYVTYRQSAEGVLVPDPGKDYTALVTEDTVSADDLLAQGFEQKDLPVSRSDETVEVDSFFVWPSDPGLYLGPDDIRNYALTEIPEIEENEDVLEETAKSILSLPRAAKSVSSMDLTKSFYGYDVTSIPGMLKILDALAIMGIDYVQQLAAEIWSDSQAEDSDPELVRAEVRGYLLDQLDSVNVL